jgi:prepilin-type N-terminal cleavage/methylation domain-containing protein
MRSRQWRSGFTLIEMVVAIALTGIVAAGAHQVLTGLIEADDQVRHHRRVLDAEANGRVWLATAVRSLDLQHGGFEGGADSMRFVSWLPTSAGWLERQWVQVDVAGDTLRLRSDSLAVPIRVGVRGAAFDYLLEPGLRSVFVTNWSSPVSAPMAIRVRVDLAGTSRRVDTLLLIVGDRG